MKLITLVAIITLFLVPSSYGAQLVIDTVGTYDTPQKMMQAADDNFDELYGAFASLAAFEAFLTGAGAYASDILGVTNEAGLVGLISNYVDQDVTSGSSPTLDGTNFSGIPIATGISGSVANLMTALSDEGAYAPTLLGFADAAAVVAALDGEAWTFTGALDLTGASSVAIGPLTFVDSDTAPSAVGEFRYVNNATGFDDGLFTWYDDDEVQYILSFPTLPTADGEIMAYDATDDQFEPVALSGDVTMDKTGVVTIATDSVSYGQTDGSFKAQTPMTDAAADFAANFTGANLYGGTFVCDTAGTIQLPEMAAGMNFTVITLGDIAVVIDTNAADGYLMDGVTNAEGKNLTNLSSSGDIAVLQYYTADDWLITTNGWTAEE